MPQPELPGIAIDRRMADLPIFQQAKTTANLLGAVLLMQPRDQFALHRLRKMRSRTGRATSLLGGAVSDGVHVERATTIALHLATDRTGMTPDQGCAMSLRDPRSMQGCNLLALLQAQVTPIAHV